MFEIVEEMIVALEEEPVMKLKALLVNCRLERVKEVVLTRLKMKGTATPVGLELERLVKVAPVITAVAEESSKCHSLECRNVQRHNQERQNRVKPEKVSRYQKNGRPAA